MTLERTRDLGLVKALIAAPGSWEAAGDDTAPPVDQWTPNDDPRICYLVARDGEGIVALYTILPQNAVCWEIHTTRVFGGRAIAGMRGAIAWAFRETSCRRLVAAIAATNRAAIRHVQACGFIRYGVNERSVLRGGRLIDQILLGISK